MLKNKGSDVIQVLLQNPTVRVSVHLYGPPNPANQQQHWEQTLGGSWSQPEVKVWGCWKLCWLQLSQSSGRSEQTSPGSALWCGEKLREKRRQSLGEEGEVAESTRQTPAVQMWLL